MKVLIIDKFYLGVPKNFTRDFDSTQRIFCRPIGAFDIYKYLYTYSKTHRNSQSSEVSFHVLKYFLWV